MHVVWNLQLKFLIRVASSRDRSAYRLDWSNALRVTRLSCKGWNGAVDRCKRHGNRQCSSDKKSEAATGRRHTGRCVGGCSGEVRAQGMAGVRIAHHETGNSGPQIRKQSPSRLHWHHGCREDGAARLASFRRCNPYNLPSTGDKARRVGLRAFRQDLDVGIVGEF